MEKYRILIIEDNPNTRQFLETMLGKEFDILTAENGITGIEYARSQNPDLVLLDVMLPILNGHDVCSLLKKDEKTKHISIVFLSAKSSNTDITAGLIAGANDYIVKPFDYKELVTRLNICLHKNSENLSTPIEIGDLKIEPSIREVFFAGEKTKLTFTEFNILRFLAAKVGAVVSREEILKEVWKNEPPKTSDRTIDVHIRAIRRKIPSLEKHITSIYGIGYKYEK